MSRLRCGPDEAPHPGPCRSDMGCTIIARTGDHGNHRRRGDFAPLPPLVKKGEIVRSDEPDEAALGIAAHDPGQGVNAVARAQRRFYRGRLNARVPGDSSRGREALGQRGHVAGLVLERIARRYHQPDGVEIKCVDRAARDPAVAAVRGVERSAQKADPLCPAALFQKPTPIDPTTVAPAPYPLGRSVSI